MSDIPDWVSKPPLSPTEQLRHFGTAAGSPSSILSPPQQYDSRPDYLRIKQLHDALPWHDEEKCREHTYSILREIVKRTRMPHNLLCEMNDAIYGIFELEGFYQPYLPEWSPSYTRAYLQRKELFYRTFDRRMEAARDAVIQYFILLVANAPDPVFIEVEGDKEYPSLPLSELYPRVADFLAIALGQFSADDPTGHGNHLFARLSRALITNQCSASGYTLDLIESGAVRNPKLINPLDSELEPQQLCNTYLRDTPLLQVFNAEVPFVLPAETRFSGHWIIAPSGRGKTTLLHCMFLDDLTRDASLIVMDSKGDLIDPIKQLAAVKDRLLLIEPDADFAFALNPLDVSSSTVTQAVAMIEYVMAGLLDAKFTSLQSALFRNVVPAIVEAIPRPTFETFKSVMIKGLPRECLSGVNAHARNFFEDRETGFYSKTYESTRKEIVWRLDYLMTNPVLRAMFSAVQTKLDIGREMDAGRIIIINNSKAILTDEGAEFFGRFFIALIARAAQQRAGRRAQDKKPCYVYIDECQTVIAKDTRIPILLDECRSQKIALILAHQRTAQLTAPVLDAVTNCAIRMANSDDEAKYLAEKLRINADTLRSLPKGTFAAFVRDLTKSGLPLSIPYTDMSKLPKMTMAEQQAIRDRMRDQFSLSSVPPRGGQPVAPPPELPQADATSDLPNTSKSDRAPPSAKTNPHTGDHTEPASKWGD